MNSLLSSSNFGLVGLLNQQMENETFYDVRYNLTGVPLSILIIFIILFTLVLLVSVYKMVPNYKGLHTFFVLLFGRLYFVPMLAYYVIGNGYKLSKSLN